MSHESRCPREAPAYPKDIETGEHRGGVRVGTHQHRYRLRGKSALEPTLDVRRDRIGFFDRRSIEHGA